MNETTILLSPPISKIEGNDFSGIYEKRFMPFAGIPSVADTYNKINTAVRTVYVSFLPSYTLSDGFSVIVDRHDGEFLVTAPEISQDLPVYGSGDTEKEAIEMFCRCLEYFYNDLIENEFWGNHWKHIRDFLKKRISHG